MKQQNKANRAVVAYHADCIDGFTSAWVTQRGLQEKLGWRADQIILVPMSYTTEVIDALKVLTSDTKVTHVYIVDFSVPTEAFNYICEHCEEVVLMDHHKSAWEVYRPDAAATPEHTWADVITSRGGRVYLHKNKCGALMCWNHFYPKCQTRIPYLVKYVNDYDLWTFERAETKGVNKYLRTLVKDLDVWEATYLALEVSATRNTIIELGAGIQIYHGSIVADLVKQAIPIEFGNSGAIGLAVNCSPQFSSDVGHELAIKSGTFGVTYQDETAESAKFSLRSAGDYDVSTLAGKLGGGGHKNAAGFYAKPDQILSDSKTGRLIVWREQLR